MPGIIAVEDVKSHLSIREDEFDGLLAPIVAGVHGAVKLRTGRAALLQTVLTGELHAGDGWFYLSLNEWPLVSVEQVKIAGTVITNYKIFSKPASRLYRATNWDLPSDVGDLNIDVNYTAGYAETSDEGGLIKLALIEWAANRFRLRHKLEYESESIGDHSAAYAAEMPEFVRKTLEGLGPKRWFA